MLSLAAGVSWASLSGARVALSASAILIDFSTSIYLSLAGTVSRLVEPF